MDVKKYDLDEENLEMIAIIYIYNNNNNNNNNNNK
jgi:hypothetical protein